MSASLPWGADFARKVQGLLDDLDARLMGFRGMAATRIGEVKALYDAFAAAGAPRDRQLTCG